MRQILNFASFTLPLCLFFIFCFLSKTFNSQVFKNSGLININTKQQQELLYRLIQTGLVQSDVVRVENKNRRMNKDSKKQMWKLVLNNYEEGEIAFKFDNYTNLTFRYLKYFNDGYFECKKCGGIFKQNKQNTYKYCKECSKYIPLGMKTLICIDCNKEFEVSSNNAIKTRCVDCYKIYRREYYKLKKKEKRVGR